MKPQLTTINNSSTYWLVQQHTTQEVVEDFTDFWVTHDVLLLELNQLVFPT